MGSIYDMRFGIDLVMGWIGERYIGYTMYFGEMGWIYDVSMRDGLKIR